MYKLLRKDIPLVKPEAYADQYLKDNNHDMSKIIQGVCTPNNNKYI